MTNKLTHAPIYDLCPHCHQLIKPEDKHGEIVLEDNEDMDLVRCYVKMSSHNPTLLGTRKAD